MKAASIAFALALAASPARAYDVTLSALFNPSSTLTLPAATTAYSSGQLVANSATAASVSVPSFTIPLGSGAFIPRLRISTNDATSTGWPSVGVQVDLWACPATASSPAPTFTNGDRAAFLIATGAACHLGSYTGTLSAVGGDGEYAELAPSVGTAPAYVTPGAVVYWTLQTAAATAGVTGASGVFTLRPEILQ